MVRVNLVRAAWPISHEHGGGSSGALCACGCGGEITHRALRAFACNMRAKRVENGPYFSPGCRNRALPKRGGISLHPLYDAVQTASYRAKKRGIPFDINVDDLEVPTHCPILGVELVYGGSGKSDNAASIDRLVPSEGYVKGNVVVMSLRANRIKNDGTAEEHEAIARFMRGAA